MGDGYVKSDDFEKNLYIDATNFYGHSMSQSLPFDEIKFERSTCLEHILNTRDGSDFYFFLEIDLRYPYNRRQKTNNSHLLLKKQL